MGNSEAYQNSHKMPAGGKMVDAGSKTTGGGGQINPGNPSVAAMDPSGKTTGSRSELTAHQRNEPVMKPVDATAPVPPGYSQVQPSGKQPDEGV